MHFSCNCISFHTLICDFHRDEESGTLLKASAKQILVKDYDSFLCTVHSFKGRFFYALNVDPCNPSYPSLSQLFISSYKVIQLFLYLMLNLTLEPQNIHFPFF